MYKNLLNFSVTFTLYIAYKYSMFIFTLVNTTLSVYSNNNSVSNTAIVVVVVVVAATIIVVILIAVVVETVIADVHNDT